MGYNLHTGSDVFTAVTSRTVSVWVMTPCRLERGYSVSKEYFTSTPTLQQSAGFS